MIRSLQIKLVLSLALLVLMLLAAAVMSMMEFRNMGDSVKGVLNNNFSSIEAAKRMMESLEREDSGLLLWIIGERDEGSQTILTSHAIILSALQDAAKNITETDEPRSISNITETYDAYHASVLSIIQGESLPSAAKEIYDNETKLHFIRIYFFRPVKHLTESIRDYYPEKGRLDGRIVSRDEFKKLEEELNNLISRLLWRRDQHKD